MAPDVTLTIAEACEVLDPPIGERQLRTIIQALAWTPDGWRRPHGRGHPTALYHAHRLFTLHHALTPWLGASLDNHPHE